MSCQRIYEAPRVLLATLAFVVTMLLVCPVCADIFRLTHGGQLEGIWLDRDQDPVEQYEIRLRSGGRIVLAATAVQEVVQETAIEQRYRTVVAEHDDDVAGHWAIAQWCRDHGMKQRRLLHLKRILRLDANHAEARRALGYTFVRGFWVTQEEFMREKGYVRYKGHWQLPQQVELLEERRKREIAQRQWYRQLSSWRRELGTDRNGKFYEAIADVKDPLAIPALVRLLQGEALRPARLLYVRALSGIGTLEAQHALLNVALTHFDEEVVHGCLDCLAEECSSSIHQRLLETLRHEDNRLVNRAALVLSRLGEDPAVGALIDALVTSHEVPKFNPASEQWELIPVAMQNPEVLTTLVALTDVTGYGFDKRAWKQWRFLQVKQAHAAQAQGLSVRRGQKQ